jgi:hypothetical protein
MTATIALDHLELEQRIEDLSVEILATSDVLRKLDLLQARCEARELLVAVSAAELDRRL